MASFGRCRGCGAEVRIEFSACPFCDTPITATLGPGSVIDDRYRLEIRIGAGGMGEVWRARHIHLDVARVLKLIRNDLTSDLDAQERFVREARLATRISHPNVALLHDFATLQDGRWYMAWELIEGRTVAAMVRERGAIAPARAVNLAAQALDGLAAVHAAGIVHRDVSPDNIMITDASGGERVKIIDLGVARDAFLEGPARTQAGMFLGKLKYASPEQLGTLHEGEPLDGRADVYSMAIVLYEMLTGFPPFEETTPHGLVLSHTTRPPRRLADIAPHLPWSPELQTVLLRALEKDRDRRIASAAEFAHELRAIEPTLRWSEADQTVRLSSSSPAAGIATRTESRSATTPSSASETLTPEIATAHPSPRRTRRALLPMLAALIAICSGVGIAAFVVFHAKEDAKRSSIAAAAATSVPTMATTTREPVAMLDTAAPPVLPPEPGGVDVEVAGERPSVTPHKPVRKSNVATPDAEDEAQPPATGTVAPQTAPPPPPAQTFAPAPRKRRFLDDRAVRRGWQRGFLPEYAALTRADNVEWAWIQPGIRLTDYRIRVSPFRNATAVEDAEARQYLDVNMEQLFNAVTTGQAGELTTDGLIWWAAAAPARPRGIGIEMIFRDESGRVVAMLRHLIRENTPADAAQEMADAVQEFVEEND